MFYASHYLKSSPSPPSPFLQRGSERCKHGGGEEGEQEQKRRAGLCWGARQWRSCEHFVIVIVLDEVDVHLLSLRWLLNILRRGVIIKDAELIFVGRPVHSPAFLLYSLLQCYIYVEGLSGGLWNDNGVQA